MSQDHSEEPPDGPRFRMTPARDLDLPIRERRRSLTRESGLIDSIGHGTWLLAVRVYLRLYHRLRVVGREHIPTQPPFILIANHASHLDAMTLASVLPWRWRDRVFPLAAGDTFFTSPVRTTLATGFVNALPLSRGRGGRHAIESLRERLLCEGEAAGDDAEICGTGERGCVYILFPEGTRSRTGEMVPFKPGLGPLVAGLDVPIVPCHLAGTHAALPPGAHLPRPRRVTLTIGPPLDFSNEGNDRAGWERIAQRAEAAVESLARQAPHLQNQRLISIHRRCVASRLLY